MSAAARFPAYYLPPGLFRPDHWIHPGGAQVLATVGPGLCAQAERGGLFVGACCIEDIPEQAWTRTAAGWWLAMGSAVPENLARLTYVDGRLVQGAAPEHAWLVPRILEYRPGHGLVCAVPLERRDGTWQIPARLAPLAERLRALFAWTPDGEEPPMTDDACLSLAADILAVNYHISMHELERGWMTTDVLRNILLAAAGLDAVVAPA